VHSTDKSIPGSYVIYFLVQ